MTELGRLVVAGDWRNATEPKPSGTNNLFAVKVISGLVDLIPRVPLGTQIFLPGYRVQGNNEVHVGAAVTAIHEPPAHHRCQPPRYRPKAEWDTIGPPLAFMRPEDRARAKPVPVPTPYRPGTLWRCGCGLWWVNDVHDGCAPPTYGWRRVQWWHWRLRRRIRQGDLRDMHDDPLKWSREYLDRTVQANPYLGPNTSRRYR